MSSTRNISIINWIQLSKMSRKGINHYYLILENWNIKVWTFFSVGCRFIDITIFFKCVIKSINQSNLADVLDLELTVLDLLLMLIWYFKKMLISFEKSYSLIISQSVMHETLQQLNVLLGLTTTAVGDCQRQVSLVTARIDRNSSNNNDNNKTKNLFDWKHKHENKKWEFWWSEVDVSVAWLLQSWHIEVTRLRSLIAFATTTVSWNRATLLRQTTTTSWFESTMAKTQCTRDSVLWRSHPVLVAS